MVQYFMKRYKSGVDVILQPLFHVNRSHWTLLVVVLKDRVMIHHDPKNTAQDVLLLPILPKVVNIIQILLTEIFSYTVDEIDWSEWSLLQPRDVPCQGNGNDCGPLICEWASYICSGGLNVWEPDLSSEQRSQQLRSWVLGVIMKPVPETENQTKEKTKDYKLQNFSESCHNSNGYNLLQTTAKV